MQRATISLPDDLAEALARESVRRRLSVSKLVRDAVIEKYLFAADSERRELPFFAAGDSGQADISERAEEILHDEWSK